MAYLRRNVGTVTDTLANATFPAGHILQVAGSDNFHSQGPFDSDHDIVIEVALTNVLASSWVVVWTTMTIYLENGAGAEGFETHIYRKASSSMGAVGSAASGETRINATGGSADSATFTHSATTELSLYLQVPFFCIDESPATGTNYYALTGSHYAYNPVIDHDGNCSILVMEIAQ